MPILNIEIDAAARVIVPATELESFNSSPLTARLADLARFAQLGGNSTLRDKATAALRQLATPAYIGLHNVKSALNICNILRTQPIDALPFKISAGSDTQPQRPTLSTGPRWPRRAEDRFELSITAADIEAFVAMRRAQQTSGAYSQDDYERNPGKYRLFRTARIAEEIKSLPEFRVGALVSIRFYDARINAARGNATMPIFQAWTDDNEDLKANPALVFACALGDFCL